MGDILAMVNANGKFRRSDIVRDCEYTDRYCVCLDRAVSRASSEGEKMLVVWE